MKPLTDISNEAENVGIIDEFASHQSKLEKAWPVIKKVLQFVKVFTPAKVDVIIDHFIDAVEGLHT